MTMMQPQRNPYLQTSVQTATPAQLLIMLYDGAIRFSNMAIEAIEKKDLSEAHNHLIRVQEIINEFIVTLDRSSPLADQLLSLYNYFNRRLMEANMKKDAEPVKEVLGHLKELRETWAQAAKKVQEQKAVPGTQHA